MPSRPGTGAARRPPAAPQADPGLQDRTLRTLMALVEELRVERDEGALLRSTLEHVVRRLGLAGGATFVWQRGGVEGEAERSAAQPGRLELAVEVRAASALQAAAELAQQAVGEGRALLAERPSGGWLAATELLARSQTLGVLVLLDDNPAGLAPDLELLAALGKQIGTGLENARLYAEVRAGAARVESVQRLTAALASSLELQEALPGFMAELRRYAPCDRLACAFVNDAGDYLEVVSHPAQAGWGLGSVVPVVGSGPGQVALSGRPVLRADVLSERRFIEDLRLLEEGLRSYLLLPLFARGRTLGALALGAHAPQAYTLELLGRLAPLAAALGLAFENVRLFERTRALSLSDDVTALHNYRFVHQLLDRELPLAERYGEVLSLIFIDLDRFKPINDQHGHLRGSRVLREVGFLLRAGVGAGHYAARYGGDEFVVLLPQTPGSAARALAERLRADIEAHTFLQEEGIAARLSASVGVATFPAEACTKEALLRLADERMYADKERYHQR